MKNQIVEFKINDKWLLLNKEVPSWVVITNQEYKNYLEYKNKKIKLEKELYNKLKIYKILDKTYISEKALKFDNPFPETAYIVTTNRCNLNCNYCYHYSLNHNNAEMKVDLFDKIVEELKRNDFKNIILTGGEPGLNKNITYFIRHAFENNLNVSVITNGTLIKDKEDAYFISSTCKNINISLDSLDEEENNKNRGANSYEIAKKAIDILVSVGYRNISINQTISRNNKNSYLTLYNYCQKNNITLNSETYGELGASKKHDELKLTPNEKIDIERNILNEQRKYLIPFFNKFCCGLGMGEIAINFNGDVFPCKILESEEFKIGNIHDQTLQSILNSDKLKKIIENSSVFSDEKCRSCYLKFVCGGGCYAIRKSIGNTIERSDLCKLYKKIIISQMYNYFY